MKHVADNPRVAVVGAGLGGLSAAIRLASVGYRVDVFEKQPGPGGKAFTEQNGAYRFDTGPSLFTMAPVFEELFTAAGRRLEDYLTLRPLDSICNYFWRNGKRMTSWADPERLVGAFSDTFGENPDHIREFLDKSREIYEITHHLFLERSLHEWETFRSRGFWSSLSQLHKIDAFRTMDQATNAYFDAPEIRQFFDRYATYNGSDPYRTPATLNIIPHVEYGIGAWAVDGGIYALPIALERLAQDVGVQFHYDTTVHRIAVDSPQLPPSRRAARVVTGVVSSEGLHEADVVISNADVTPTYENLLGDTNAPLYRRYQKLEPSSSGLVFYWGVGKRFPELGLHNIFFSDDYRREFSEIFDEGRCPSDPTIYINITSKEGAPGDAPEHGENWFILVNAPADRGQDWGAEGDRLRTVVLDRLSRELNADLAAFIEEETRMTPPDIAAKTDSHRGSLYGIASNTRLAAFLRHPNRSRRYPGLYFVGGSAHPGGGMPLVVLGGKITAKIVQRRHPIA